MNSTYHPTESSYQSRIFEATQTLKHLGVMLIAFIFVVVVFMLKEGKIPGTKKENLTRGVVTIPSESTTLDEAGPLEKEQGKLIEKALGIMKDATSSASPGLQNSLPPLDLKGPWQCGTISSSGRMNISIKDKNIRAFVTQNASTENTLVTKDCMYTWTGNSGTKQCGMGQYIDLFETLTSSGMVSIPSMIESQMKGASESAEITNLLSTCKKTPIEDTIFVVPSGIQWKETTVENGATSPNSSGFLDLLGQ